MNENQTVNQTEGLPEQEAIRPNYDYQHMKVTQSNVFVRSPKAQMSVFSTKLLRFIFAQVCRGDLSFKTYSVSVKDLQKTLNIRRDKTIAESNVYQELKQTARDVMALSLMIETRDRKGNRKLTAKHCFNRFEYDEGKSQVTISMSNDLAEFLLDLGRNYTQYDFSDCLLLPSENSIKLFELLVSWRSMKEVYISLDELREYFFAPEEKYLPADVIRRIIEPNVAILNKKVFMSPCSYEVIKEGRKIAGVKFTIGPN